MTCKYGDEKNVKKDVKTLTEIRARQGSILLIDVIAEGCGEVVNKFKLTELDGKRLKNALMNELEESINERI